MIFSRSNIFFSLLFVGMFFSCNTKDEKANTTVEVPELSIWLDEKWDLMVEDSPEWQTYLGIKTNYDSWDNYSSEHRILEKQRIANELAELQEVFDFDSLSKEDQLSYRLFELYCAGLLEDLDNHYNNYHVNQMFGRQSAIPSFLINFHAVSDTSDAFAYVSRLKGIKTLIKYLINDMQESEKRGVVPPQYVLEKVLSNCENVITGAPFDSLPPCPLLLDFKNKVVKLEVDSTVREQLILEASTAIKDSVGLAYLELIEVINQQLKIANEQAGVWKFPNGSNYYAYRLRKSTTTNISPEDVMEIGLSEVSRIHGEMEKIKEQVGFKGELSSFFDFVKTDAQFYYPNTKDGKDQFLSDSRALIDSMKAFLPTFFYTFPKAELEVRPVEAFREKTAGSAFYYTPAPDGSRPGIYYVNLYDMRQQPNNQMEALAYHEAIPGHHMQLSIAQEMNGLPKFRKHGVHFTAYVEGWGLYSEYLPKEYGFYKDPYSDFGRLSMELWRACRLVVDVGIHYKKWSREEAIEYYSSNTPNPENDCVKMVERHIVMPGQATSYKIGQLKILELREKAKQQLGERFDIKAFHDVVLKNGALPLALLEEEVDHWIFSH